MAIKLNGSTSGSVALDAPADTSPSGTDVTLTLPVNDGDAGQYLQTDGTGTLSWQTVAGLPDAIDVNASAPADSLVIDSAGKLGIGVTSPLGRLDIAYGGYAASATPALVLGADIGNNTSRTSNTRKMGLISCPHYDNGTDVAMVRCDSVSTVTELSIGGTAEKRGATQVGFYTAANTTATPSEKMRLDGGGSLGLGYGIDNVPWSGGAQNNSNGFRFVNATNGGSIAVGMNCNNETVCVMHRTNGTGRMLEFKYNNSVIGYVNGGSSSVSYNTSSDYRLKENVVNLDNAIPRVKQLLPRRFNWISDESNTLIDGFIAHEAATVVPEAVTGTHNEVEVWKEGQELPDGVSVGDNKLDEDGNTIPVYQGIDQSKLVPLLTAALQEAIAKIEALETRLTALEGGAA